MGPIVCPETSVRDYHHRLRNAPEGRMSHLLSFVVRLLSLFRSTLCYNVELN